MWQLTHVGNMKFLREKMEDLSDRKLELEERIEIIEKEKMIMEKQELTQKDWNQYEEIKFQPSMRTTWVYRHSYMKLNS